MHNSAKKPETVKLNIGSGGRLLPGYINVDPMPISYLHGLPDGVEYLQADAFDLRNYFPSGSVNEVYASHFFEHLTFMQVIDLLYLLWDIGAPGGKITIIVPDTQRIMEHYVRKHEQDKDFSDIDVLNVYILGAEPETLHNSIWYRAVGLYYLRRDDFYKNIEVSFPSELEIKFTATFNK